jgi:CubicO group peptidase (beta-lactamase class C family)
MLSAIATQATRAARALLEDAVARHVAPCTVALVGSSRDVLWREAVGRLWFGSSGAGAPAATVESWFDLASLTKPLATTLVTLDLAAQGAIDLHDPIVGWLPEWRTADRAGVTLVDCLEHASGLPARLPTRPSGAATESPEAMKLVLTRAISAVPLEYPPRTRSIYSDLGFILLGILIERIAGVTLDARLAHVFARLAPAAREIQFGVPAEAAARTAPTDPLSDDPRAGRRLRGEVHDDYAAALGGVAGHAGLFGTVAGVAAVAAAVLRSARGSSESPGGLSAAWTARSLQASTVPGSSRALGWDHMLTTSSCGTRMSTSAFGHVGFTGTSLWIDPARDRYYVLLTNRACSGGTLDEIKAVRRAFHDALADV